jgi:hypothetical protein
MNSGKKIEPLKFNLIDVIRNDQYVITIEMGGK